jgi:hypothetical protein
VSGGNVAAIKKVVSAFEIPFQFCANDNVQ